jgi:DNA invertase Pin-like site-specific DNA recombinase
MTDGKVISYLRVSTDKQGKSGLGIAAQQKAIEEYLSGGKHSVVASFTEVESGKRNDRPKLLEAIAASRLHKATLVVAKVDRLTRSVGFLHKLIDAGVDVRFCDLPQLEGAVGRFMLTQMVAVAELEAGFISKRTKDALASAKARGTKLGGNRGHLHKVQRIASVASATARSTKAISRAKDLAPIIKSEMLAGQSLRAIAQTLDAKGITTPRGSVWTAAAVQRVIKRLEV